MHLFTILLSPFSFAFISQARGNQGRYAKYSTLHCPVNADDTLPTPTYGLKGDVFTVCTEQLFHAPITKVYNAIVDFKKYSQWNTFTIDVQLPPNVTQTPQNVYVGMPMVLTTQGLIPGQNTTSNERITFLSPPNSPQARRDGVVWAVWRNDGPTGAILAEHPSTLSDAGGGRTRYLSYETYYKGGAIVAPIRGPLSREFTQQGVDLMGFVESGNQ